MVLAFLAACSGGAAHAPTRGPGPARGDPIAFLTSSLAPVAPTQDSSRPAPRRHRPDDRGSSPDLRQRPSSSSPSSGTASASAPGASSRAWRRCKSEDGAIPFSFTFGAPDDGRGYVRSGAVAWIGYAAAEYLDAERGGPAPRRRLCPGPPRAAKYLLARLVSAPGDLRGRVWCAVGRGRFAMRSTAIGSERSEAGSIEWTSVEHNVDAYFFLRALVGGRRTSLRGRRESNREGALVARAWRGDAGQFAAGVAADGVDTLLDRASWGSVLLGDRRPRASGHGVRGSRRPLRRAIQTPARRGTGPTRAAPSSRRRPHAPLRSDDLAATWEKFDGVCSREARASRSPPAHWPGGRERARRDPRTRLPRAAAKRERRVARVDQAGAVSLRAGAKPCCHRMGRARALRIGEALDRPTPWPLEHRRSGCYRPRSLCRESTRASPRRKDSVLPASAGRPLAGALGAAALTACATAVRAPLPVAPAAERPLPRIEHRGDRYALVVDGAPFLMLGAQINNSSAWPAFLPKVWPAIEFLHANTVEVTHLLGSNSSRGRESSTRRS